MLFPFSSSLTRCPRINTNVTTATTMAPMHAAHTCDHISAPCHTPVVATTTKNPIAKTSTTATAGSRFLLFISIPF
ncbi:MAG: hypothetical protein IJ761_06880 [Bacteroidales bacterium]|nr:hypothetical protein [Bacteroidales bacterium]